MGKLLSILSLGRQTGFQKLSQNKLKIANFFKFVNFYRYLKCFRTLRKSGKKFWKIQKKNSFAKFSRLQKKNQWKIGCFRKFSQFIRYFLKSLANLKGVKASFMTSKKIQLDETSLRSAAKFCSFRRKKASWVWTLTKGLVLISKISLKIDFWIQF